MLREFAVLAILARPGFAPASTRSVRDAIIQSGWRDVLPERYQQQVVHRALAGLELREHASHADAFWQPTAAGLQFVEDHIDGNPNVNPEAREEAGCPSRQYGTTPPTTEVFMFHPAVIDIGRHLAVAIVIIAIAPALAYAVPRTITALSNHGVTSPWRFAAATPALSVGPIGSFTLVHGALVAYIRRETDRHVSLDYDGALAASLSQLLEDAYNAGAIHGPRDVEMTAYATGDGLIISVREGRCDPSRYAFRRQISTSPIETTALVARDASGEDGAFAALEACLARATQLLPALSLLQAAERLDEGRSTTLHNA
jgi:hypothetical protein